MDSISLSFEFAEKYIRFSKPEYLQMYLYLDYYFAKNGEFPKIDKIARELDIAKERVIFILDFWVSRDELIYDENGYHFPTRQENKPVKKEKRIVAQERFKGKILSKPSYTMEEIKGASEANKSVSALFYQSETVLNKVLNPSDMEMLYSFVDWLGLPVEVVTMLLSYAARQGKTGRRYLETIAIDWADRGIDSFEAAEAYISELEALDGTEREIRSVLGIYDRALTQTEKKYISMWVNDSRIKTELIPIAYDRTVKNTGKLSWAYMNKILQSWADDGITTIQQIESSEEFVKKNNSIKKRGTSPDNRSKLNNYKDTNQLDYSKLDEKIFDIILDN